MPTRWSLSLTELSKILAQTTLCLITEHAGTPIGFCAIGYKGNGPAGIVTVLVESVYQWQGVGMILLQEAERILRSIGITRLNVGFGSDGNYFWPGVPIEAGGAWKFFVAQGWIEEDASFDLVRQLKDYQTPSWVYSRLTAARVALQLARPELDDKIISFEQRWFPAWTNYFRNALAASEHRNVLLALDCEQVVVGAVLLRSAGPAMWDADLGSHYGTINVLGVAADRQGQGIGIALAAKAMEILRERQCDKCYIQWTGLVDWYGKLGAEVWAEYRMASKPLLYRQIPPPFSSGCHVLP